MKQGSTLFLRLAIWLIGLFILSLCIFVLPRGITEDSTGLYAPIIVGMYIAAIPFFSALYQAIGLLTNIDNNKAFSRLSVKGLRTIKFCAIAITTLFVAGLPYIYYAADKDDAPGVLMAALVISFASTVIVTFSAVLQKLVQTAVEIKEEHDLTV